MKAIAAAGFLASVFAASMLAAQETPAMPQMPTPQKEHEWLQRFVGEWESESEGKMGPDQPAMHCKGTIKTRALGGFWVVSELSSEVVNTSVAGNQAIGYDPQSKKYVGSWIDSMTSHMWKYEGTVDEAGAILTLEAEGPNFMSGGKLTKFRDVYEFKSDDHIAVSSSMQGEDGQWVTFMTGNAKRKK